MKPTRKQIETLYRATISIGGKNTYLGTYATPEEAARVYDAAAKKHYAAFARFNFPEEHRA